MTGELTQDLDVRPGLLGGKPGAVRGGVPDVVFAEFWVSRTISIGVMPAAVMRRMTATVMRVPRMAG